MGLLGGFGSDKTPKRTRRAIWMPRKALWAPFVVGTPILCWSALDGPKGEMGQMWALGAGGGHLGLNSGTGVNNRSHFNNVVRLDPEAVRDFRKTHTPLDRS